MPKINSLMGNKIFKNIQHPANWSIYHTTEAKTFNKIDNLFVDTNIRFANILEIHNHIKELNARNKRSN